MYWSICIIYHIWRRQQYSGGICWSYSCVSAHQTKYPIFCSTHVGQTMILHIDHRQLAHLYQNCNLCDPCISWDQCRFYSSMLAHQTKYPIFCGKWVGWPIWQIEYSKSAELSNIVYTIFVEQARYVCVLQQRLGQPNCISAIQCQACWPGLCTGDNMSAHLYHIYDIPCFCHQLWDNPNPQLNSMEGQSTVDFQSTTTAPNRGAKAVRAVDDPQSDLAGSTHSSCISCLPPEQFLEV